MRIPSACDYECNKTYKIAEFLDIKNFSCKKSIFDKLVLTLLLTCEDEILNTTETSLDNEIAISENNCLISLVIVCTLLLTIFYIVCYYYYTRYSIKRYLLLSFNNTNN